MSGWSDIGESIKYFFSAEGFGANWLSYLLEFLLLAVVFYFVFKILANNHARRFIVVIVVAMLFCGIAFLFAGFEPGIILIVILMICLLVYTVFSAEVKRSMLDSQFRPRDPQTETIAQNSMDEILRAIQNMSKKHTGALIVLSDGPLPKGVIESGTMLEANITAEMIESVFFHNAPLHDGAMILEKNKIKAAGCFLPAIPYDALPKDMGSRHRAALSIANLAPVTAIVVSEETGIISIMDNRFPEDKMGLSKTYPAGNGQRYVRYATDADLRYVLRKFYWDYDLGDEEDQR